MTQTSTYVVWTLESNINTVQAQLKTHPRLKQFGSKVVGLKKFENYQTKNRQGTRFQISNPLPSYAYYYFGTIPQCHTQRADVALEFGEYQGLQFRASQEFHVVHSDVPNERADADPVQQEEAKTVDLAEPSVNVIELPPTHDQLVQPCVPEKRPRSLNLMEMNLTEDELKKNNEKLQDQVDELRNKVKELTQKLNALTFKYLSLKIVDWRRKDTNATPSHITIDSSKTTPLKQDNEESLNHPENVLFKPRKTTPPTLEKASVHSNKSPSKTSPILKLQHPDEQENNMQDDEQEDQPSRTQIDDERPNQQLIKDDSVNITLLMKEGKYQIISDTSSRTVFTPKVGQTQFLLDANNGDLLQAWYIGGKTLPTGRGNGIKKAQIPGEWHKPQDDSQIYNNKQLLKYQKEIREFYGSQEGRKRPFTSLDFKEVKEDIIRKMQKKNPPCSEHSI